MSKDLLINGIAFSDCEYIVNPDAPQGYYKTPTEIPTGNPEHAKRFSNGKIDLSLLLPEAVKAMCQVSMFGAKKYGRENWRKGWGNETVNVCTASALRHIFAILKGELIDPESGCPHAAHAMWNLGAIIELEGDKHEQV